MGAPKARITADGVEVWHDGEWQLADVTPQTLPVETDEAPQTLPFPAETDEWWDQPGFWQGESPY